MPSPIPATVTEAYSEEAVYQEATDSAEAEQETPQIGAQEADRPEEQEAFEPSVAAFEPNVTESLVRDRASESISDSYETANNLAESSQTAETIKTPSPHALLNQWYERYPNAFFKGHTKPLKIGIHQDLAEREAWPNKLIRRALANYVNLPRYIKAVRVGAERVDLDGQPAGKVDKEAAQHASEKRGDKKEGGDVKERAPVKKAQPKPSTPTASKRPQEPLKQAESEKSEPRKTLSLEDKLLGLQQKFKGR